MIRYIFLLLPAALIISCGNNTEYESMRLIDSMREADSMYAVIKAVKYERFEHLRDSLVTASFFLIEGGDCVSTKMEESRLVNKHALSITVLSYDGQLNYVSKVSQNDNSVFTHNGLRFTTASDTAWLFDEVQSISLLQNQLEGKQYEEVTFADFNDVSVADFIIRHHSEEIKVTPMSGDIEVASYVLSEKDKKAVAECAMLANVFKELNAVYNY